jgi:DNA-binding XRE family transcriptional regulator
MNPRLFKLMRQAAGYNQSRLAAELDVSPTLICLIEKGEKRLTERVERRFREVVGCTEESEIMATLLLNKRC